MGLFGENGEQKETKESPKGPEQMLQQLQEKFANMDDGIRNTLREKLGLPGRILNEGREGLGKILQGNFNVGKGLLQTGASLIPFVGGGPAGFFKGIGETVEGVQRSMRGTLQVGMAPVRGIV